jgi:hypothetical protein
MFPDMNNFLSFYLDVKTFFLFLPGCQNRLTSLHGWHLPLPRFLYLDIKTFCFFTFTCLTKIIKQRFFKHSKWRHLPCLCLLDNGGEPRSTRSHYSTYQLMFRPESSLHPRTIPTSYIYTIYSPSISSMVRALRDRENIQTVGKFPSPTPHLPLKHLCFIVFACLTNLFPLLPE